MSQDVLTQLTEALKIVQKQQQLHTKAPGDASSATMLYQPGGLFSIAGMDRVVISTHIAPQGIGNVLPVFASNLTDPRYGIITGFGAASGSEASYPCDDAPKGYMKSGTLTAAFGRIMRQTQTIEIDSLLAEQRNSTMNLQLMGEMMGTGPINPGISTDGLLNMVVKSEMIGVGVQFERKLSTLVWSGSPANNDVNGGYKEFPGLDAQIATGQTDAETGTTMPAVDSLIMDFAGYAVDSTTADIVEYLSSMTYYIQNLASRTGLTPASWAIVMRPELWFELSAIWPCRYLSTRCSNDNGTNITILNDDTNTRMRDEMRRGKFIDINGVRYPVITDDGIYEYNNINHAGLNPGEYESSIYMVPLRIRGNFPTLYWEHIDYRQIGAQLTALGQGQRNVPFWTENGRFLWVYRDNSFCFDLQAKVEPRIVLRTPQLAAKLQNVKYTPLQHLRSPDPDSPYWKDGGVSSRSTGASYAVWGNRGVAPT